MHSVPLDKTSSVACDCLTFSF